MRQDVKSLNGGGVKKKKKKLGNNAFSTQGSI